MGSELPLVMMRRALLYVAILYSLFRCRCDRAVRFRYDLGWGNIDHFSTSCTKTVCQENEPYQNTVMETIQDAPEINKENSRVS
jgi:hypothetical protein